jgi:hypothetical protein
MLRQSSEYIVLRIRDQPTDIEHERTLRKAFSSAFSASMEDASTHPEHTLDCTSLAPVIPSASTSSDTVKQQRDETRRPRNRR